MPASWVRLSPAALIALAPVKWRKKSGTMVMVTVAKKHLTAFVRKREAPRAGNPKVKQLFTEAAHKTLGKPFREDRNEIIKNEILKAINAMTPEERKTYFGTIRRKSRSKVAGEPGYECPLVYELKYEYSPGKGVRKGQIPTNIAHIVLKGAEKK